LITSFSDYVAHVILFIAPGQTIPFSAHVPPFSDYIVPCCPVFSSSYPFFRLLWRHWRPTPMATGGDFWRPWQPLDPWQPHYEFAFTWPLWQPHYEVALTLWRPCNFTQLLGIKVHYIFCSGNLPLLFIMEQ